MPTFSTTGGLSQGQQFLGSASVVANKTGDVVVYAHFIGHTITVTALAG